MKKSLLFATAALAVCGFAGVANAEIQKKCVEVAHSQFIAPSTCKCKIKTVDSNGTTDYPQSRFSGTSKEDCQKKCQQKCDDVNGKKQTSETPVKPLPVIGVEF